MIVIKPESIVTFYYGTSAKSKETSFSNIIPNNVLDRRIIECPDKEYMGRHLDVERLLREVADEGDIIIDPNNTDAHGCLSLRKLVNGNFETCLGFDFGKVKVLLIKKDYTDCSYSAIIEVSEGNSDKIRKTFNFGSHFSQLLYLCQAINRGLNDSIPPHLINFNNCLCRPERIPKGLSYEKLYDIGHRMTISVYHDGKSCVGRDDEFWDNVTISYETTNPNEDRPYLRRFNEISLYVANLISDILGVRYIISEGQYVYEFSTGHHQAYSPAPREPVEASFKEEEEYKERYAKIITLGLIRKYNADAELDFFLVNGDFPTSLKQYQEYQKHCNELLAKQKPASKEEMLAQMKWHLYGDSTEKPETSQPDKTTE